MSISNWISDATWGEQVKMNFEQTPVLDPPIEPYQPPPLTGNIHSCYCCGRGLTGPGSHPEWSVKKEYLRSEKTTGKILSRYLITLCTWCDWNWRGR